MSRSPEFEVRGADWVRRVTDAQIARHVGELSFERALVYFDAERVLTIRSGDRGRLLLSTVDGSRDRPYTVMITLLEDDGDPEWTSRCSCPVATECKHVAATLLTARESVGGAADPVPAWRRFVQQQLDDPDQAAAVDPGVRLGLRCAPTRELRHGRLTWRLLMTPSHRTKANRWAKQTGWGEVGANRLSRRFRKQQAEALSQLKHLARGTPGGYYSGNELYLDECGPAVWGALREVVDSGVELLPAYGADHDVQLIPDPVRVQADFRREADGSVVGRAELHGLPDEGGDLLLIGDPPHGVVLRGDDDGLTLAGTDRLVSGPALALLRDGPVQVPAADAEEFVDLYLPRLNRRLRTGSGGIELAKTEPLRLRLAVTSPDPQTIEVAAHMLYAAKHLKAVTPDLYDTTRDRKGEHELVQRLEPALREAGLLQAIGGLGWWPVEHARLTGWRAVRFAEQLDELTELDGLEVAVDGELPAFEEVTSAPQIIIGASDSADSDWLDLHVTVTLDGEEVPFAPLFAALARGDDAMLLDSGTWFTLGHPDLQQLERLIAEARELSDMHREGLSINRFQVGLWEELESIGVVDQQSARWARQIELLRGLDEFTRPVPPDGLKAQLRPYQLEGFTWLAALWDCALGGVLADDMGLGKTLQTLALLARARDEGELTVPVLVVAPSSVVGTWIGEAAKFVPDLEVVALAETSKRRGTTVAEAAAGAEVVVTSYAVLRLDADQFAESGWNGLVLDEAQSVKNHKSKTFQAAKRIGAPFTLAITGTPLENSLMDLWSMLALAAPGLYPRPEAFTQRYRKPIERGEAPELLDQLRGRIRPLMLRRTKEQVAADLPPKQEQVLSVELTPRHRQTYDRQLQRERQRILGLLDDPDANRVEILASLTRLRQLALDPRLVDSGAGARETRETSAKLALLVEQLVELAQEGHRALVFSQFTSYLALARDALTEAGLTCSYLDGRTRDRQKVIDDFKQGDQAAFLISLKAGGVGLTLTEADYVFVLDPWWNPATEAQAIDRTHRIGQDRPVMVYRLVSAGTIEEKVVALQERKRALFEQVVDGGGLTGGAITPDDIRGLLE